MGMQHIKRFFLSGDSKLNNSDAHFAKVPTLNSFPPKEHAEDGYSTGGSGRFDVL